MKRDGDFARGVRARCRRREAAARLPVYLDEEVQSYLVAKAESSGIDLSDLVNGLLKKEIDIMETVR